MKNLFNIIRNTWICHRYMPEGISFESDGDGFIRVFARFKGKRYLVEQLNGEHTLDETYTDYGLARLILRGSKAEIG